VQHFSRFQLTVCSHVSSALAEFLVVCRVQCVEPHAMNTIVETTKKSCNWRHWNFKQSQVVHKSGVHKVRLSLTLVQSEGHSRVSRLYQEERICGRQTMDSTTYYVSWVSSSVGSRAFSVAGPRTWSYSYPVSSSKMDCVGTFKRNLKAKLFMDAFLNQNN